MKKNHTILALLIPVAAIGNALASQDVTTINTSVTPGTPSTSEGYNFDNAVRSATSLSTATASYVVSSLVDNVFVRRNTVNANQSSVWYANNGTSFSGVHQSAYDEMLLTNNIYVGTDNTFANGTSATTGNIERLDFTWDTARIASSSLAFAVFDRGVVGLHDSFSIAAITAVDASGNPTAYGSLLKVAAGWGGTANAYPDQAYNLFRYANGDNITASTASNETNTQGVGGIVFSTSDLGLANGTQVYGYSLMAADVAATNSAQLVDFTNASFYPTATDGATGGGGIDLAALNGLQLQAVPEPSTWLFSLGFGIPLAFAASRRRSTTARG